MADTNEPLPLEVWEADLDGDPEQTANAVNGEDGPEGEVEDLG